MQSSFPVLFALLGWLLVLSPAWSADVRRATAVRTEEEIRVDGVLDEEVWRTGPTIGELVQANPFAGQPPTEPTEVRIAYNDHTLYIAARCFYRDPKTIFTSTTARDAAFWNDDDFEINLDTFHDRRNAYFFAVNAAGAMTDGRVIENRNVDIELGRHLERQDQDRRPGMDRGVRHPLQDAVLQSGREYLGIQRRTDRVADE